MNTPADLPLGAATPAVLSGCWKLAAGRAVTLSPRRPGVLRIAHGQVWATVDGPHPRHGNESGDRFLSPGQTLTLRAGQRLVIEPWLGARARVASPDESLAAAPAAWFSWDYLPEGALAPAASSSRWQVAVAQPLADLRLALGLGVGAVGRLALGVAGFVLDLAVGRGRGGLRSAAAFNAQSHACRAH